MKLLFAFFICFSLFSQNNSGKISWSPTQNLEWQDFKGKAISNAAFVASTNSGITFQYSYTIKNGAMDVTYSVESNFYPQQSWFQVGKVSPYILKHEQTHFDISELHARMLRKKLAGTRFTKKVKSEIESIYRKTELQRKVMQAKFDAETDHSRNVEKEVFWEKYVKEQLSEYEDWR